MARNKIGALPVVDSDGGPLGIVSASDLLAEANLQLSELTLRAQMESAAVVERMASERDSLENENQQHGRQGKELPSGW